MTDKQDPALAHLDPTVPVDRSAIHVLAIGVGHYAYAPKSAAGCFAAELRALSN